MLDGSNIKVYLRLRPIEGEERLIGNENVWQVHDGQAITLKATSESHFKLLLCYNSDQIFDKVFITREIFNVVALDFLRKGLTGINVSILAYGQTATGKTFTMLGNNENPGIIPLSLEFIFNEALKDQSREYSFRMSLLEIYNETVSDLLYPDRGPLKISESWSGVFVNDLAEEPVASVEEALALLAKSEQSRRVGDTKLNEKSSRSHAIFRLILESRDRNYGVADCSSLSSFPVLESTITFVDLAGSEKPKVTGAEGVRLKEGAHINTSLLTLTRVISQLSREKDRCHVSYRDSKLTRILQDSLGGNSFTAIICAATPASEHYEETLSTLKFAASAKAIKLKPKINEKLSEHEQIRRLTDENNRLCHEAAELKRKRKQGLLERAEFCEKAHNYVQEAKRLKSLTENLLIDQNRFAENLTMNQFTLKKRLKDVGIQIQFNTSEAYSELLARCSSIQPPVDDIIARENPPAILGQLTSLLDYSSSISLRFCTLEKHVLEHKSKIDSYKMQLERLKKVVEERESDITLLLQRISTLQTKLRTSQEKWLRIVNEKEEVIARTRAINLEVQDKIGQFKEQMQGQITLIKECQTLIGNPELFIKNYLSSINRNNFKQHYQVIKRIVGLFQSQLMLVKRAILDLEEEIAIPSKLFIRTRNILTAVAAFINVPKEGHLERQILRLRLELEKSKEKAILQTRQLELKIIELQDQLHNNNKIIKE